MLTALADDSWWYDLTGVNATLVDDDETLTLVDAGLPWHGNKLIAGLSDAGYELRDLDRILLTHFDLDHVGGLTAFDGVDVTIYVGERDAPLVTGEEAPPLDNHKGAFQRLVSPLRNVPDNDVVPLADGDTVGSFTVYHTPGHTPGHVCYVSESLSLGLLGDLVREDGGRFEPSPWLLSYDTAAVARSISEFADRSPDFEIAIPGHGVPFEKNGSAKLGRLAATL
ncbi:Glyoxylase, beta-lactamase superfamily II [Haloarcula vallismortis]|uniref:Metallo-beta-lactamase superfamily protein n=2 Tax=Haloarcula vallismortis TaxID=28442 RepID=M0IW11_HALVA|nr:MBL fold metallo-hydrolase [Haloarcula vallismortis]EMA01022.1 metallo-beta-lactamase superfamily protein [Haloarcula vallismortis ATCC 29715]SDW13038.1 Glyoxylase, beta-lactamase superfamily II [Haloarcula vallismortis]